MKKLILIQTTLILLGIVAISATGAKHQAMSYALGAGILLINLLIHVFVWGQIFQKKLIALSTSFIVFKYAIFGAIIYKALKSDWIDPLWFCVGIGSLLFAVLIHVTLLKWLGKEDVI